MRVTEGEEREKREEREERESERETERERASARERETWTKMRAPDGAIRMICRYRV